MPKRVGVSRLPTVNINGHWRTIKPGLTTIHDIGMSRLTDADRYAYYRIGERRMTAKNQADMMDIRENLAQYAEIYGTQAQANEIRSWNLNRLKWLIDHDIIVLEEYFVYDETSISDMGALRVGMRTAHIQRAIDDYNNLYAEGRAIRQQRRRARDWA